MGALSAGAASTSSTCSAPSVPSAFYMLVSDSSTLLGVKDLRHHVHHGRHGHHVRDRDHGRELRPDDGARRR